MPVDAKLGALKSKISGYGKENQGELLHALAAGATLLSGSELIRIYLEDLTRGGLSCVLATGHFSASIMETPFPLISGEHLVSNVFVAQSPAYFRITGREEKSFDSDFARRFGFRASYIIPIASLGKSIGVLCIDQDHPGDIIGSSQKNRLADFTEFVSPFLDKARIYHQQVQLARELEAFKHREAAELMARSAVKLIEKLSLASVLVPTQNEHGTGCLGILASYSEDRDIKSLYDQLGAIDLAGGKSLFSEYIDESCVIRDGRLLAPLFIPDIAQHHLQKRALIDSMSLRSLYVVPRFVPGSRRIICIMNYYSRDTGRFSDFEMGLLQTHAEMVERVISEVGGEHLEIRVLSEITELLNVHAAQLQPFLTKVLSKATELIGADTGSIALQEEFNGVRRVVVEDEEGNIIGAKNKEWLKKYIPPFLVGGEELKPEERSLTGYVAATKQAKYNS